MKGIWAIIAFAAILLIGPIAVGPVVFADGEDIGISSVGVQSVQPLPLDDDDDDDDDEGQPPLPPVVCGGCAD